MGEFKCQFRSFVRKIDKEIIFISIVMALAITYYVNPLNGVELTSWNRTFCSAILSGISVDKRINEFYKLFFLVIPGITILLMTLFDGLFQYRESYKDYFAKLSIFTLLATFASYISRYTSEGTDIAKNPLLQCVLSFLIVLTIISLMDFEEKVKFEDVSMLFLAHVIMILLFNMFGKSEELIKYVVTAAVLEIAYAGVTLFVPIGDELQSCSKNLIFILFWLPAVARLALEGLYFGVEHGHNTERYFTHIIRATIIFFVISCVISFLCRKTKWNFKSIGYIGAITSITTVCSFSFGYQYTWRYSSFGNVYELGNGAVAMDSVLYGKLPIIDYFSAHALGDVWTKILYCVIHNDIGGIFANPYGGFSTIIAFIILFFITKHFFDDEIAILYVLLFPGSYTSIIWVSVCSLTLAMLLYIYRKPKIKSYLWFWIATLIGAFYTYDEGISIGVASILSYLILRCIEKEWEEVRDFVFCGAGVGATVGMFYVAYALITGIPVISRIKEWISVSLNSSSSWATSNFGNQSSFAFFVSYFLVPMTAVTLMVFVLIKYIKYRKHGLLVVATVAYSLAEILYITRTIVYHNLAICSGRTGVLLNFIHWTVSLYVLYMMEFKEKNCNTKLFAWTGAMMLVMIAEGTAVTGYWPSDDAALLSKGLKASDSWNLQDGYTDNNGQRRIVADEDTTVLINSFKTVFDTLLEENETFLDFANITSMYAMTGRVRPFYVGQSPSLLTDLYSQECFLNEIAEYDCPLAVVGTTETSFLNQMTGIPHNIRYYKVAEYIYSNYRPLITFNEFAIWCENDKYDEFSSVLSSAGFYSEGSGYMAVDYGYDFTTVIMDDAGNTQFNFWPYHSYDLQVIPYLWANYDEYKAISNVVVKKIKASAVNTYTFDGSQSVLTEKGNYLAFDYTNRSEDDISINIVLYDSQNDGARIQYYFTVKPGTSTYLIRISGDYFWDIYNIDTILYGANDQLTVNNVRILEGD